MGVVRSLGIPSPSKICFFLKKYGMLTARNGGRSKVTPPAMTRWFALCFFAAKSLFSQPFQGFVSRAFCVDLQFDWYLRLLFFTCKSLPRCPAVSTDHPEVSERVGCYMKVFRMCWMLHETVHSVFDASWTSSERNTNSVLDVTWKCSERSTKSMLDVTWNYSERSTKRVFDVTWKCSERSAKSALDGTRKTKDKRVEA